MKEAKEATILGQPLFGQIEPGQHLQAGDQTLLPAQRDPEPVLQQAMDAQSQLGALQTRVDVQVRRAAGAGTREQGVDPGLHLVILLRQ